MIPNFKQFWLVCNLDTKVFRASRTFFAWVEVRCRIARISRSRKSNWFWKFNWETLSSALWSGVAVRLCGLHWHHSTQRNERQPTSSDSPYLNVCKVTDFERNLRLSELQRRSDCVTRFPILRREMPADGKKFSYFNMNWTLASR
jgi:hypothetical protein